MTRKNPLQRMAALLLCVFLCLGTVFFIMGAACAANEEPPAIAIEIMLPPDWASTSAAAKVCVTDRTGGGFASVEVRVDRDGSAGEALYLWRDITASMERRDSRYYGTVAITANCTVYVRVIGHDGKVYENSRYMECFDTAPPTLRGSVSGDVLRVEVIDDLSGVAQITVNGNCYAHLTNGAVDVPLKDLGGAEKITVQAVDCAGNYSQTYQMKNPNYKIPGSSQPIQDQKPTDSSPATTTPVKPSTSTPPSGADRMTTEPEQTARPLTPDGQGTVVDNVTDQDSKEFFTFTTPSENSFYLVIDRQRESENVYFLNAVTESDLLALAEKDKGPEDNNVSAIPAPEPVCACKDKCVPGEVNTDCPVCVLTMKDCAGKVPAAGPDENKEPEKPEKSSSGTMILLLIAALAMGGAGYYLKIWKPKHDLDDAEDFDELTGEDEEPVSEETVNEDDLKPVPWRIPGDEPEYPEGYGYDGLEGK